MSSSCTLILVGVTFPVSEIKLALEIGQISLFMVVEKFNRLESAQKIYACRG